MVMMFFYWFIYKVFESPYIHLSYLMFVTFGRQSLDRETS